MHRLVPCKRLSCVVPAGRHMQGRKTREIKVGFEVLIRSSEG
jgi:hypothetical protein